MPGTPNPDTVLTKQRRIAFLAAESPQMAFTSLNHYLDLDWLHEAFRRTRKNGAPGIDGQTWVGYEENLEENLQSLLNRAKSGTYRAPPVRRVHIPKGGSKTETRPIGIPTLEDKVLQRAVTMILEAIYERDFLTCSYGFRRGRSAHQALEALWKQSMGHEIQCVLDVDVQKFFDTLDHGHLRDLLQLRIRDGVLLRLIGKWLRAGILEEGVLTYPTAGSPQGGVISPMLANVYLHYVLDVWFHEVVLPRLRGRAFLIRFADDFAVGFTDEEDAHRVLDVLPKRFSKYGLTIHPEKTRLVPFRKPRGPQQPQGSQRPGTFDFLGFTHYWARSRKGNWVVKRKTASGRLSRSLSAISQWCRRNRHIPISDQHRILSQKLRGHYNYYGITGNSGSLRVFHHIAARLWCKWLRRRNSRQPSWEWFNRILERYPLPRPIAIHSVCRVAKT
jgi:group II intron reverse transcriptase/maturase